MSAGHVLFARSNVLFARSTEAADDELCEAAETAMSSAALLRRATLPKRRRYSQAAAATRILGCGARHLPPGPPHHMVLHRSDGAACIIAIAMILAAQNGHLKVGRPCSATAMSVGQAAEARELLEESYRWCHAGASSLPHALPLAATPPWIVQELSWGD